jgi:hypothetical protein
VPVVKSIATVQHLVRSGKSVHHFGLCSSSRVYHTCNVHPLLQPVFDKDWGPVVATKPITSTSSPVVDRGTGTWGLPQLSDLSSLNIIPRKRIAVSAGPARPATLKHPRSVRFLSFSAVQVSCRFSVSSCPMMPFTHIHFLLRRAHVSHSWESYNWKPRPSTTDGVSWRLGDKVTTVTLRS